MGARAHGGGGGRREIGLEVGLVKLGILASQLQEHGVIEKLVDRDILREALAPPSLDHKFTRQVRRRLRLQWPQCDVLVERIARDDGPMIEGGEAEGLSLCVRAKIGLKPKRVDDGDERLEQRQRGARTGTFLHDVSAPPSQDGVNGGDAIERRRDLNREDRLHDARRRHEEGGVGHAPGGGDDLTSPAMDRLGGNAGVEDLELDIPHRLITQRPLTTGPLEALQDVVTDRVQQPLVHLRWQRVVHEDVGSLFIRRKPPHRARREQVPIVALLEEIA
mmetsp:Transcript_28556/g.64656  ORF Transcript_28556/g.64656 Transcript_28556/m.64656 type:complete len:277 (+) Transcript_28556:501-1331(+)